MNCTIDASIFVSAVRPEELHYTACRRFLQQAQTDDVTVFCPTLILPECAAAIARPTGDAMLAEELVSLIETFPGLRPVMLDTFIARRAAQIATTCRLRGADSIYVAVAEAFDATLVTWDEEMLQHSRAVVSTQTPAML